VQREQKQKNIGDNGNNEQENIEEKTKDMEYDYDNIYIKNKSPEDSYITNNDLSMAKQMNTAQINIDSESRDKLPATYVLMAEPTNHRYNLRPNLLKEIKYIMTQVGQQSAKKKIAKPHARVMITQMNI